MAGGVELRVSMGYIMRTCLKKKMGRAPSSRIKPTSS
jgi:hypothetical protein